MTPSQDSPFVDILRFILADSQEPVDTQSCRSKLDAVVHARDLAKQYGETIEILSPDGETLAVVEPRKASSPIKNVPWSRDRG